MTESALWADGGIFDRIQAMLDVRDIRIAELEAFQAEVLSGSWCQSTHCEEYKAEMEAKLKRRKNKCCKDARKELEQRELDLNGCQQSYIDLWEKHYHTEWPEMGQE